MIHRITALSSHQNRHPERMKITWHVMQGCRVQGPGYRSCEITCCRHPIGKAYSGQYTHRVGFASPDTQRLGLGWDGISWEGWGGWEGMGWVGWGGMDRSMEGRMEDMLVATQCAATSRWVWPGIEGPRLSWGLEGWGPCYCGRLRGGAQVIVST